jgi:hypothetical protein
MSVVPQRAEASGAGGGGGNTFAYRRQSRLAVWLE